MERITVVFNNVTYYININNVTINNVTYLKRSGKILAKFIILPNNGLFASYFCHNYSIGDDMCLEDTLCMYVESYIHVR